MIVATQLWLGTPEFLQKKVQGYLSDVLGREISASKQHHSIVWLKPEGAQYKRSDLEILFDRVRFKLDDGQKFFFIIQDADSLTQSTGNSLLKSLEEPPTGYHFILCAQRKDLILPTIISRCIVHDYRQKNSDKLDCGNPFFVLFTKKQQLHHAWFDQCFTDIGIDIQTTRTFLDQLIGYWYERYTQAVLAKDSVTSACAERCIQLFSKQFKCLPMPGGAKIFWRNLFVQFQLLFAL